MFITICLLSIMVGLNGCMINQASDNVHQQISLKSDDQYALLPLLNVSQTPMAAEKVETILASLLRSKGINHLQVYPAQKSSSILNTFNESNRHDAALTWATKKQFDYLITGSVQEWRYKAGLDGEPAVGITLKIMDSQGKKVLWTATGARSGWGREAASMTAHEVLKKLLSSITLDSDD